MCLGRGDRVDALLDPVDEAAGTEPEADRRVDLADRPVGPAQVKDLLLEHLVGVPELADHVVPQRVHVGGKGLELPQRRIDPRSP